jgi:tetratricopeptide (TPR) repeat protein
MKTTTACGLDCIKQLLTNIGSSGLAAGTIAAAPPIAAAVSGAAVPLSIGAISVLAYIGLSHRGQRRTRIDHSQAQAAIRLIRQRTADTRRDVEELSQDLVRLGFDFSCDHDEAMHKLREIRDRLDEVDRLAHITGKRDDEIIAFLKREEGLLVSLGLFLEKNFDELRDIGVNTQATIVEIKQSVDDLGAELHKIKRVVDGTADAVQDVRAAQCDHGAMLARIIAMLQRGDSTDSAESRARVAKTLTGVYPDKLGQEPGSRAAAERAAEAVMDVKDVPGIEAALHEKGGQAIVDALLARVVGPQRTVVEAHRKVAEWAYLVGNIDQAAASLAIVLAIEPKDIDGVNRLGHIHRMRGEYAQAEECYKRLQELAFDDETWIAKSCSNLGVVYQTRGDLDGAEQMYKRALAIDEKLGRLEGMAVEYGNLGVVYGARGNLDGAEEMYKKALVIDEKLGRLEGMAAGYGNLGVVYRARGDLDGAEQMYRKALAIDEKLGRLKGIANRYGSLGKVFQTRGDLDGAEEMYRKALSIDEKLRRLEGVANQYVNLGSLYEQRKQLVAARECWQKSVELYGRMGLKHRVEEVDKLLDGLDENNNSASPV